MKKQPIDKTAVPRLSLKIRSKRISSKTVRKKIVVGFLFLVLLLVTLFLSSFNLVFAFIAFLILPPVFLEIFILSIALSNRSTKIKVFRESLVVEQAKFLRYKRYHFDQKEIYLIFPDKRTRVLSDNQWELVIQTSANKKYSFFHHLRRKEIIRLANRLTKEMRLGGQRQNKWEHELRLNPDDLAWENNSTLRMSENGENLEIDISPPLKKKYFREIGLAVSVVLCFALSLWLASSGSNESWQYYFAPWFVLLAVGFHFIIFVAMIRSTQSSNHFYGSNLVVSPQDILIRHDDANHEPVTISRMDVKQMDIESSGKRTVLFLIDNLHHEAILGEGSAHEMSIVAARIHQQWTPC